MVSFYKDFVINEVDNKFPYLGLILIGLSFLFTFFSIFGFHKTTYWGGYFQLILDLLIIYDYSDIRLTKPEVWKLNKGFYSLSAVVEFTFMVIMFKNHTLFDIIHN